MTGPNLGHEPPTAATPARDLEAVLLRLAAVEEQLGLLATTEMMESLKARVVALETAPPSASDSPEKGKDCTEANVTIAGPEDIADLCEIAEHTLQESVWEVPLLVFTPVMDMPTSLNVLGVFFMNVFAQLILTWIVITALAAGNAGGGNVSNLEEAKAWRETVAHNYNLMDRANNRSLATRVCGKDTSLHTSLSQLNMVQTIEGYLFPLAIPFSGNNGLSTERLPGPSQGPLLACMCLLLWTFAVLMDIRMSLSFLMAILKIPRGITSIVMTENQLCLQSITRCRMVMMFVVVFLRFVVAFILFMAGSSWLANTTEIGDLLLNAAALTFVMEFDELLFVTALPSTVQVTVSKFEGLPRKWPQRKCLDFFSISVMVMCAFVLVLSYTMSIDQVSESMMDVYAALCGGDTDFVVAESGIDVIYFSKTHSMNAGYNDIERLQRKGWLENRQPWKDLKVADSAFKSAALERVWRPGVSTLEAMSMATSTRLLPAEVSRGYGDISINNINCSDFQIDKPAMLPPSYYWALVFQAGLKPANPHEKKCEFFADACNLHQNPLVRWMCPQTCGCDDPLSGLLFKHAKTGCPMETCQALPGFKTILKSIKCEDPSVQALEAMPGWIRYWIAYEKYWQDSYPSYYYEIVQPWVARVRQNGCSALPEDPFRHAASVCAGSESFSSLRTFCPIACSCNSTNLPGCPMQCSL